MKSIKIYLIIVSFLLVLAIGALVYVWYIYQSMQSTLSNDTPPGVAQSTDANGVGEEDLVTESGENLTSADIVIDTQKLTESQRSILSTFGYKGDTVTIPHEVVACAEQSVGEARFTEILDGGAPTPFELLKLSPCLKK